MDPIDAAVAAIEAQDEGEQLLYTEVADRFNISRHTLARRCKGT
jgi:AraC-like DNA-binding protein